MVGQHRKKPVYSVSVDAKYCRHPECEQENPQPASEFFKHIRHRDGLGSYCRECIKRMKRKDYKPFNERTENKFTERDLYAMLSLARTGIGLGKYGAEKSLPLLMPDAPNAAKAKIYLTVESVIRMLSHVEDLILWVLRQENERESDVENKHSSGARGR